MALAALDLRDIRGHACHRRGLPLGGGGSADSGMEAPQDSTARSVRGGADTLRAPGHGGPGQPGRSRALPGGSAPDKTPAIEGRTTLRATSGEAARAGEIVEGVRAICIFGRTEPSGPSGGSIESRGRCPRARRRPGHRDRRSSGRIGDLGTAWSSPRRSLRDSLRPDGGLRGARAGKGHTADGDHADRPEGRLAGRGRIAYAEGYAVADQELSVDLEFGARGHLARILDLVGPLKDAQDALGYRQLSQPGAPRGVAPKDQPQSQWRDMLVQAPIKRGAVCLTNSLVGRNFHGIQ